MRSRRTKTGTVPAKHDDAELRLPPLPDNWTWAGAEKAGATCIQQMQGEVHSA